jgi:arylsulfatase A
MLGVSLPASAGEDSQSFLTALTEGTTRQRVPMIHHSSNGGFAIRDGRWKLVMGVNRSKKRELYDLSSDSGEHRNVVAENLEIAKRLERALTRIVVNGRSTPGDSVPNDTGFWDDLYWMDRNDYVR